MGLTIVIPGKFPGLNEFIDANRRKHGKWNAGNQMKQRDQKIICAYLPKARFKGKIYITYHYFEPNSRRDKDNISGYFHKIFQDALVQTGCIENDGWKHIKGWADHFDVDKGNPRIEVEINEVKR